MIWTDDNIRMLTELYPETKNDDIAKMMNISLSSIKSKANRLKLKKSKIHKSNMISKRNKTQGTNITENLMRETALKYKTRGEFQRLDGSIYTTARASGLLDEICSHMVKCSYSIPQLILFYIIREIFDGDDVLYNINDAIPPYELDIFIEKHQLAFEYDGKYWHRNKDKDSIKDKICLDRNIKLIRIVENNRNYVKDIKTQLIENIHTLKNYKDIDANDIEKIMDIDIYKFVNDKINDLSQIKEVINRYKYYSDFIKNEKSIYFKLKRRGILEELTIDLIRNKVEWNDELIKKEVSKYENLIDFIKNSQKCYLYCKRNKKSNLLDPLYRKQKIHDLDEILNTIKKYEYLYDFKKENLGYYTYLKHKNLLHLTQDLKRYKNRVHKD